MYLFYSVNSEKFWIAKIGQIINWYKGWSGYQQNHYYEP